MAGIDDLLSTLPIDDIASKLGVDADVARQAIAEGGGAILSGLQKNAATPEGAEALTKALAKHAGQGDKVDVDKVDQADGKKILKHVFSGEEEKVAKTLSDEPKTAGIDFGKLLPVLAPIVLGILAKQTASKKPADAEQSSGGIGDLIGGLLSGASNSGIDVGGIIGGLLGGKR